MQGATGSSPFFGTNHFKINELPPWCPQHRGFGVHCGVHFAAPCLREFEESGYIFVYQDVRGRYESEGVRNCFYYGRALVLIHHQKILFNDRSRGVTAPGTKGKWR